MTGCLRRISPSLPLINKGDVFFGSMRVSSSKYRVCEYQDIGKKSRQGLNICRKESPHLNPPQGEEIEKDFLSLLNSDLVRKVSQETGVSFENKHSQIGVWE